eukprot:CAMPEP_0206128902 /NCGR_PEP_ID=MMETSP1472-20131121/34008_1 /ASSEMBLY_ACC=CAM_ASM_001108 /TAXON_ID=41880 /ORGANISM="Pycnococcus provasolii, Strain RCC251" /LENGTH=149 /DNA_ID=CAMNT_0053520123 /DNA_START=12 /DNA_END=461 /DNA_ORIENTATION=-
MAPKTTQKTPVASSKPNPLTTAPPASGPTNAPADHAADSAPESESCQTSSPGQLSLRPIPFRFLASMMRAGIDGTNVSAADGPITHRATALRAITLGRSFAHASPRYGIGNFGVPSKKNPTAIPTSPAAMHACGAARSAIRPTGTVARQ